MDIEPPIKAATDSDDNKSNDSTASQPQHLQEMAKSTVVMKETAAPVAANDNANAEAPISVGVSQPQPMQIEPPQVSTIESKPTEMTPLTAPAPIISGMHAVPPGPQIPPSAVPGSPIPHGQEAPIPPPNVTVSHHQGGGIPGSHLPPHGAPHGAYAYPPQGPRAPFYGHMPPYQQGFQQYPPYGHHMPPYQQNYHAPPHGYPVPGPPPGAENPYPIQTPAMNPPIPHQPLPPQASVAVPPATATPQPEEAADKNGS